MIINTSSMKGSIYYAAWNCFVISYVRCATRCHSYSTSHFITKIRHISCLQSCRSVIYTISNVLWLMDNDLIEDIREIVGVQVSVTNVCLQHATIIYVKYLNFYVTASSLVLRSTADEVITIVAFFSWCSVQGHVHW